MKNNTTLCDMLQSKDKDCIYMAVSMIRNIDNISKEEKRLLNKVPLIERIRYYEDVCRELGEDVKESPYDKIKQIEKLFYKGWVKDWSNVNQYKYYPYFVFSSSIGGLVFGDSGSDLDLCGGQVAYFPTREISDFVGKTFVDIYRELMK